MLDITHRFRNTYTILDPLSIEALSVAHDDIVVNADLGRGLSVYNMWRASELREIAHAHQIPVTARDSKRTLTIKLGKHHCTQICDFILLVFTTLRNTRGPATIVAGTDTSDSLHAPEDEYVFYKLIDDVMKTSIIQEWEDTIRTDRFKTVVCAVCARTVAKDKVRSVHPHTVDLRLLRNDALPPKVRPTDYDYDLFERALLDPAGISDPWRLSPFNMCPVCNRELFEKRRMPKLSLANWLYYGHSALPNNVARAFRDSTQFDRLLVGRARGSRISFRFCELHPPDPHDQLPPEDPYVSQRCIKGNILVMPQNTTQLNSILPPPYTAIRDTVCAVFVGQTRPTRETMGKLSPVLVRKSRVKTIAQFLCSSNPHYVCDTQFHGFSQHNLDELFGPNTVNQDEGVPCAMEVGHIDDEDIIDASTSDYTTRNHTSAPSKPTDDILMENVGYTCGDDSPISYRDMKMKALSYCLNGGSFVQSRAGERFVPDFENPSLLTWMFPHLDPWGIGGFHHPDRTVPITMQEQLKYLISIHHSPFQKDPDFAFVYYNILQKKTVCDSVRFRVNLSQQREIVQRLLGVDRQLLEALIIKFDVNPHYEPQTIEEKDLVHLVSRVGAVTRELPGTTGYKLRMRNEIKSLVHFRGTPAFFLTINPSDINHPLVRLYAGEQISLEAMERGQELTEWRRKLLVARNPASCAKFFHTMIATFIDVILRHGRPQQGLFGKCSAYYGTVEAQGRGTLHCHMLIWIEGHPNPQRMRDQMTQSTEFREHMILWLESIIKSELLGMTQVIIPQEGVPLARPRYLESDGYIHPGVQPSPALRDYSPDEFKQVYTFFVNQLVEQYNWHEHTSTCWKHLKRNDPKDDSTCRMRMNGITRPITTVDEETGSIQLRRLHPWIANYNDVIMFAMKCNMDLKHIGSGEGAKALIYYVTDYITKASLPTHLGLAALLYALKRADNRFGSSDQWQTENDSSALTMVVNSMLSRQEISHQQVMSYIVGGGDCYTSHRFRVLHLSSFERYIDRTSINDTQLQPHNASPTTSENITTDHLQYMQQHTDQLTANEEESVMLTLGDQTISAVNQVQDYVFRPDTEPFHSMCIYEFVGLTEKITAAYEKNRLEHRTSTSTGRVRGRPQESRSEFLQSHPQHDTHLIRKRVVWVVPVLLGDRIPRSDRSEEEYEQWARIILILFRSWRHKSDLKSEDESWTEAYERVRDAIYPKHGSIIHNMNVLSECRDARDLSISERKHSNNSDATASSIGIDIEGLFAQGNSTEPGDDLPVGAHQPSQPQLSGRKTLTEVIGDLITIPALDALDRCYGMTTLASGVEPPGTASIPSESDMKVVATEMGVMRALKRQRVTLDQGESQPISRNVRPRLQRDAQTQIANVQGANVSASNNILNVDNADLGSIIRQVIVEKGLDNNGEQLRAYEIVARHICFGGSQLLMFIGGVGGTGKSYVVDAILRLFTLLGRRPEILVSAPTGAAATLINGFTIHSLLLLPRQTGTNLQKLTAMWAKVNYLIIDEVSMIGALLHSDISNRIQQAKGLSPSEDIPFGGVNVIFTGDFGQLKPVLAKPVYSHGLLSRLDTYDVQRAKGISAIKGAYLWRLVNNVVLLKKNQRQRDDPIYAELLARVRVGKSEEAYHNRTADDYATLQRRLMSNLSHESLASFHDAPIIVGTRVVRDLLNLRLLEHHARATREHVHIYYSADRIAKEVPTTDICERLWDLRSTATGDALGQLPLFPGMKVMVQENLAFGFHVVNGAIGTVRDIKYEVRESRRYPIVVYVHIPGIGQICPTASKDVVPIFPVRTTFRWTLKHATENSKAIEVTVTRSQLPLLPAYVYTDYKSQGRSLDHAIVDPATARTLQGVYVMLSRVRTLNGLAVLRTFPISKIHDRLSQELRKELMRFERLDYCTAIRYNNDTRQFI